MVRGPRFVFFGGKGGVGKTTCASAAAARAAAEGSSVLVVSTDPAHSLSDALGLELGPEPRRVREAEGELHACELDADKALSRWLRDREDAIRTIANRGTYFDEEDIDRFFSLSFPGVDELVGLLELTRLSRLRDFDVIVVDTAPTGHTLRLLDMPSTLLRLSEVLDDMHAKHRFLASSLGGSWRGDFADDVIAEIEREAKTLRRILRDPRRASFTWVTAPEEMPVRETEDGVRELTALGVLVDIVVVNAVWPEPSQPCALCSPRALVEWQWREYIGERFADRTVLEVPARTAEPAGPAAARALAASVRRFDGRARFHAAVGRSIEEDDTFVTSARAPSSIPLTTRLLFVGGKGGVGKTTLAAAHALEIAELRRSERVLCVSTDPAHSLGDAFGMELGDEPRPLPDGPPNLELRELDAAGAWEVERERHRRAIHGIFSSLLRGRMDASFDRVVLEDLLDLAPPGIDELFAMVTLLDALLGDSDRAKGAKGKSTKRRGRSEPRRYDLVVVDTAPTGHTLRLLSLPEKVLEWVHALMSIVLKYRKVIGLGEFASDLTRFAKRLRALIELLRDPARCSFVIVTRPALLPTLETERFARELRRLEIPLARIVANAVTTPSCPRCAEAARRERPILDRLERLAHRAARSSRLLTAPAVFPGPRGPSELGLWRDAWSERDLRS